MSPHSEKDDTGRDIALSALAIDVHLPKVARTLCLATGLMVQNERNQVGLAFLRLPCHSSENSSQISSMMMH